MALRERVLALDAALALEASAGRAVPRTPAAVRALRTAEIVGSLRFAALGLRAREIEALLTTGLTPAAAPLEACNAVADYTIAAAHVGMASRQRRRQPLLRVEEIVALHALATRRSSFERPGEWRTATAATQRSGAVPPPAWFVPRDVTALVERFAGGRPPEVPFLLWLASFHARLRRIHPFTTANGRVARLCLNLLSARSGFPPLVIGPSEPARFAAVLDRAAAGELWPSALFIGRSFKRSMREWAPAPEFSDGSLVPLAEIAGEGELAGLYKAAQRGRLRTAREGTSVFTNNIWLNEYRSSRAPAGRPRAVRPKS